MRGVTCCVETPLGDRCRVLSLTFLKVDVAIHAWLVILIATNAISLAIDAWDTLRFLRGEKQPHYRW